jgi:catalase
MNHPDPIPYSSSVEVLPPNEIDDIRRVVEALKVLLQRHREKTGHFRSDVHVKPHGCASAEFRVLPNLPLELAQGIFQHPRTLSAMVRFSNSANQPQADFIPDGRGLAIKVFEVDGERLDSGEHDIRTQDFVMVNHPVFFARNVKDFLRVEEVLVSSNDNPLSMVTEGLTGGDWNPLNWHWREAVTAIRIASHLPAHPASNTYYSMAPIRYGQYVAKYRIRPAGDQPGHWMDLASRLATQPDALRLMLEETLRSQQLLFEFQVQLRTSAESMPVEDATIEWPESESPYRTVALLLIPRQEIDREQNNADCRRLAFNVWHAIEDHRPLGGINRLRREVYPISAAWRLRESGVSSKTSIEGQP